MAASASGMYAPIPIDPHENVFALFPWQAGYAGGSMFAKAFLIPAVCALPFALHRNDWTWLEFFAAWAASFAMGFLPCFTGSLLWHAIGEVRFVRAVACSTLPFPIAALPCMALFARECYENPLFTGLWIAYLLVTAGFILIPAAVRIALR